MDRQPAIPSVDAAEAERQRREAGSRTILLDVREPDEFATVRAPDALLMPTSTFLAELDRLPAERPLLVICHSGQRSAAVTAYLLQHGRDDVANVTGGMLAWERAGLPVRRGTPGAGEGELPS